MDHRPYHGGYGGPPPAHSRGRYPNANMHIPPHHVSFPSIYITSHILLHWFKFFVHQAHQLKLWVIKKKIVHQIFPLDLIN